MFDLPQPIHQTAVPRGFVPPFPSGDTDPNLPFALTLSSRAPADLMSGRAAPLVLARFATLAEAMQGAIDHAEGIAPDAAPQLLSILDRDERLVLAGAATQFSCLLDVGTPDNAARALALFESLREADQDADEPEVTGFDLVRQDAPEGSTLWIHDDEHGDVEAVIRFVLRLAEDLDLTGLWGLQYALTCSRPRLDAFGGGAHVIDLGARKSIGWTSSQEWLSAALNGEDVDA